MSTRFEPAVRWASDLPGPLSAILGVVVIGSIRKDGLLLLQSDGLSATPSTMTSVQILTAVYLAGVIASLSGDGDHGRKGTRQGTPVGCCSGRQQLPSVSRYSSGGVVPSSSNR